MDKQAYIAAMEEYFDTDRRRICHALKVLDFATRIAMGEGLNTAEEETVWAAAILHDIGIKNAELKYGSAAARYQELEGPAVAAGIMDRLGETADRVGRVKYIIGHHHTREAVDGLDFQIIWEADLLVNIEEEGWCKDRDNVARLIETHFQTPTGAKLARSLYLDHN